MNFFYKNSIFVLFFLLVGCVSTRENEEGAYFKEVINHYFSHYNPNEEIWVDKQVSKYSITDIYKSDLSLNDFEKISEKLKQDGWVLIAFQDDYHEFCLGGNLYMGILYPSKGIHRNSSGNEIKYTDKDKWLIGLSYSEGGVNYCLKEKLPVIDLD